MKPEDIRKGGYYIRRDLPRYFRRVEFIIDSPMRSGGKCVRWSTDSWSVSNGGHRYGTCSLNTFAKWAHEEMDD